MDDATGAERPASRRWRTFAIALWCVLVAAQVISPRWYPSPDVCCYLSIARSMATSTHVTRLGSPNLFVGVGYPALISPAFLVAREPFFVLSLIHAGWAVIFAVGIFRWVRRYDPGAALPVAMLTLGNAMILMIFRRALSDVAFMGVMIWLINAYADAIQDGRVNRRAVIAAILLQTLLALIRAPGILFVLGFVVQVGAALRRGELSRARAVGLVCAVGLPATLAVTAMLGHSAITAVHDQEKAFTYIDVLRGSSTIPQDLVYRQSFAWRIVDGVRGRACEISRLLLPGTFGIQDEWPNPSLIIFLPVFALFVFGFYRLIRRRCDAYAWSLPAYFLLHVYWAWDYNGRYPAPFLPLVLLCCWLALDRLGSWRTTLVWSLVVIHLAVALGHWVVKDRAVAERTHRYWHEMRRLAKVAHAEAGPLVADCQVGDAYFPLIYYVDRPVQVAALDTETPPAGAWLVMTREETCPPGWTQRLTSGPFKLLQPVAAHP
jgi:hypothetical protein